MAAPHSELRTRLAFALALTWDLAALCCNAYPDAPADHAVLLDAIRQVESGGNDRAVGDHGRSTGPLQTSRAAWADATRHGGVSWDYDALVWSWPHSQQVAVWYWQKYGCDSDEKRARCWNGGPGGHRKKSTLPYWRKVQHVLVGAGN